MRSFMCAVLAVLFSMLVLCTGCTQPGQIDFQLNASVTVKNVAKTAPIRVTISDASTIFYDTTLEPTQKSSPFNLRPGKFTIVATSSGFARASKDFTVSAMESWTVSVDTFIATAPTVTINATKN